VLFQFDVVIWTVVHRDVCHTVARVEGDTFGTDVQSLVEVPFQFECTGSASVSMRSPTSGVDLLVRVC